MTIGTALLLTALCAGADQGLQQASSERPAEAGRQESQTPSEAPPGRPQATSGITIAADIEGRVAIYDGERRLVVELDKPAGRQLQVALEPGAYEARLGGHGRKRMRFQIGDGQQLLVALANFRDPDAEAPPPGFAHADPAPHHHRSPDGRHRIEVRFGGWGDGWYHEYGDQHWSYSGSAQAAFGLEYLNFIRNDIGIGLAITTLASANGGWDDEGAGRALCSIPIVARWYPIRRLTRFRSVEPYATVGIGPVFAVDAVYSSDYDGDPYDWDHDHVSSGRVGTAFGGRIGGGVDFRLGSVFTLGLGGAWNWDTGFSDGMWRGARPSGGEFTVALGWNFGR
jgi:hypothetical protein